MEGEATPSTRLAELDANMIGYFRLLAMANPGGDFEELDGLTLVATGAAAASFNVAFVTRPLPDPSDALGAGRRWFSQRKLPFCVRVRSGLDPETGRACRSGGFTEIDTMPCMLLGTTALDDVPCDRLDILEADEPGAASDQAQVLTSGFPMPEEFASLLVAEGLLRERATELYVGYHAGQAVASSSLVVSGTVAGIYNVATLPGFRHRGYGEAMTRHAIARAYELGCDIATLQATPLGRPIYERMGFRTVAHYLTYQRPV
jgi:GNAT superfamily N-acetyltransferase